VTTEQLAGLEEQRDVLLKSLRDLDDERAAGEVTEADYATLKDDYTARAAAVLRAIEARRTAPAGRPRPAGAATRRRRAGRRPTATGTPRHPESRRPESRRPEGRRPRSLAITLGVAFAIAAVAGISVVLTAGGRDPGAPVTGSGPGGSSSTDKVAEALSLETQGRAVDALKLYDEVLADEPDNVEALAYRGWLLKRAGLADKALESLDRAVVVDPSFPDAHFFRGMVLFQDKDDPAGAAAEFRAFLANDPPPDFVADVQEVLARAEEAAAAKAAGTPVPAPAPAGGAPEPASTAPAG
jgi:tetratricopeptide (TPR) repeat protein